MRTCIWGGNSTRTAAYAFHARLGRGSPLYRVSVHALGLSRHSFVNFDFKFTVAVPLGVPLDLITSPLDTSACLYSARTDSLETVEFTASL